MSNDAGRERRDWPEQKRVDWLAKERARLTGKSRDWLIDWLVWNDPNGVYTDEDAAREDFDPLLKEDAVELTMEHVSDNMETPEEMRKASWRRNPIKLTAAQWETLSALASLDAPCQTWIASVTKSLITLGLVDREGWVTEAGKRALRVSR